MILAHIIYSMNLLYLVRRVFSFDAGRHLACMVVVFITAYPHLDKPFRMSREVKVVLEGV